MTPTFQPTGEALPWVDLTLPLDADTSPFTHGDYRDPPFRIGDWCGIPERGFWVSRLEMGTQTGTHVDAPAHFVPGGATLDSLPLEAMIGPYFRIVLDDPETGRGSLSAAAAGYSGEPILLLQSRAAGGCRLREDGLRALLALGCRLWVAAADVVLDGRPPWAFNREIAENGVYLVEGVSGPAANALPPTGSIIVLPLRIQGAGGSPCRVVALPGIRLDLDTCRRPGAGDLPGSPKKGTPS